MELKIRYRVTALKDLHLRANIRVGDCAEDTTDTFPLQQGESRDDVVCVLEIIPALGVPEWQLIPHPRAGIGDSREFHGLIRLERIV